MTAPTAAATARDGRPASVASPTPSNGWCGRTSPGGRTGRPGQIRLELGNPLIILLGMDRLNYSKGILHRLRAYGSLLDSGLLGPQQAVFVQVASPRQDRVEQYQQLLQEVEALVGRINDEQTTLAQPAIRYLHQSYPREEIAALYLTADIMLVTSLRDGMNLVAKELRLLPSPRRRRTRALRIHRCFRPRRGFLLRSTRLDPDPVPRGEFPQHVAPAPSTAIHPTVRPQRHRDEHSAASRWPIGPRRTNRSPHSDAGMTVVSDLDDEGGRGYHQPAHRRR